MNKIITRGFGINSNNAGIVTQGYGLSLVELVPPVVERAIRSGHSGSKRYFDELDEIIVWAKLIEVNDMPPKNKISGTIRVRVDSKKNLVLVERISHQVRSILDKIKITISHVKK